MYPTGHSVGVSPLVYVLMVAGVLFWTGVAFYLTRKALLEKQENALTSLIAQLREKKEGIFWIIAPTAGGVSLLCLVIEIYKVSHFSGMVGQYMILAFLGGVAAGISVAAGLYGNE